MEDNKQILINLIQKFKKFIIETIQNNNDIKGDHKNKIIVLISQFMTEDVYQFKQIIKLISSNEKHFLNKVSLNKDKFSDVKREKYYRYISLFKDIYQLN